MNSSHDFDIIVIGTGAGGGTLVRSLAGSGLKILVLERGSFLPREPENWSSAEVFGRGRYKAHESWMDGKGKPFEPGIHYFVGGNTKVFGAALLRFRERDFGVLEHAGGTSPAWPVSYEEFEPWYGVAERLYKVHGQRGIDPTEPKCSSPYSFPPVAHEPRIKVLESELRTMGLAPFPLPMGVALSESDPVRSSCIKCSTCDGFPCLQDAKSDSDVTCVRPALRDPNVTLWTGTYVRRLLTNASGSEVDGVEFDRDGETQIARSRVVVVSCGAVNSAALLLRSRSPEHPRGLANASGVVGRNYMCHNNSALLWLTRTPNSTRFQKTLGINDWYFGTPEYEHPLGHVQLLGKADATMLAADAPRFVPRRLLSWMASRSVDFWLTSEDLPDPENRVSLSGDGQIRLAYKPNNLKAHHRLLRTLKQTLRRAHSGPSFFLSKTMGIAATAHQCGTVRFGTDSRTSALDVNCRAHDVKNLFVVDGSFFVSSTAVNPALTIMANALRVGSLIRTELGARSAESSVPAVLFLKGGVP